MEYPSPNWVLLTLIITLLTPLHARANDNVVGEWAGESSIIKVTRKNNTLSAIIVALQDPVYLENEELGPIGTQRRDDQNPDETLQQRPLIGLDLLRDYLFEDKRWQGKIYDPESGNVYSSRMEVSRDGKLKMRGYIGLPMIGRTAIFESLSTCTERMRKMLQRSEQTTETCPHNEKARL
jgi:uncharacterized protein (DUF2147 family)